jgi:hypothetical protein
MAWDEVCRTVGTGLPRAPAMAWDEVRGVVAVPGWQANSKVHGARAPGALGSTSWFHLWVHIRVRLHPSSDGSTDRLLVRALLLAQGQAEMICMPRASTVAIRRDDVCNIASCKERRRAVDIIRRLRRLEAPAGWWLCSMIVRYAVLRRVGIWRVPNGGSEEHEKAV